MYLKRFLYLSYRRFYITSRWRKTRFSKAGGLVFILMGVSAVTSLDVSRNSGYSIFSILFTVYFFSIIFSKFLKIDLKIERELPEYGTVDEELNYYVKIKNNQDKKKESLFYMEIFSDPRPSFEDFITRVSPDEKKHNIWDQKTLYYRWDWLVKEGVSAKSEIKEFEIDKLKLKSLSISFTPLKRGILKLKGTIILQPDIFNIYRALKFYKEDNSIIILPKRYPINPIILKGDGKDRANDESFSKTLGYGGDFFSLREYRKGDPLKSIHWKSWAKLGKPIVKEYQKRTFIRNALILDTFGEEGDIFEEAVSITASFVSSIKNNESMLDIIFIQDKLFKMSKTKNESDDKILKILATIKTDLDENFYKLELAIKDISSKTSSIILILLKLDSKRANLIDFLTLVGIKTKILLLTDREEKNIEKKYLENYPISIIHTDTILDDLNSI